MKSLKKKLSERSLIKISGLSVISITLIELCELSLNLIRLGYNWITQSPISTLDIAQRY